MNKQKNAPFSIKLIRCEPILEESIDELSSISSPSGKTENPEVTKNLNASIGKHQIQMPKFEGRDNVVTSSTADASSSTVNSGRNKYEQLTPRNRQKKIEVKPEADSLKTKRLTKADPNIELKKSSTISKAKQLEEVTPGILTAREEMHSGKDGLKIENGKRISQSEYSTPVKVRKEKVVSTAILPSLQTKLKAQQYGIHLENSKGPAVFVQEKLKMIDAKKKNPMDEKSMTDFYHHLFLETVQFEATVKNNNTNAMAQLLYEINNGLQQEIKRKEQADRKRKRSESISGDIFVLRSQNLKDTKQINDGNSIVQSRTREASLEPDKFYPKPKEESFYAKMKMTHNISKHKSNESKTLDSESTHISRNKNNLRSSGMNDKNSQFAGKQVNTYIMKKSSSVALLDTKIPTLHSSSSKPVLQEAPSLTSFKNSDSLMMSMKPESSTVISSKVVRKPNDSLDPKPRDPNQRRSSRTMKWIEDYYQTPAEAGASLSKKSSLAKLPIIDVKGSPSLKFTTPKYFYKVINVKNVRKQQEASS